MDPKEYEAQQAKKREEEAAAAKVKAEHSAALTKVAEPLLAVARTVPLGASEAAAVKASRPLGKPVIEKDGAWTNLSWQTTAPGAGWCKATLTMRDRVVKAVNVSCFEASTYPATSSLIFSNP